MDRGVLALCAALALCPPAGARSAHVGRAAPNCALVSLADAQPWELQRLRGRVLWVDFWASWCSSCAESFRFLDDLEREFGARGFQVVGINVDEDPEHAKEFLERHPAAFTQAADASGRCPRDFDLPGMPTAFLIDREGVIRHVELGFRAGATEEIRSRVRSLLAEGRGDVATPEGERDAGRRGDGP